MGLYFGGKLVSPVVTKEVAKTIAGVGIDVRLELDGATIKPANKGGTVDLSGITTVHDYTFYYFIPPRYEEKSIINIIANDVVTVKNHAFSYFISANARPGMVRFNSLTEITNNNVFYYAFPFHDAETFDVVFLSLKTVSGKDVFTNLFGSNAAPSYINPDKIFPVLEDISGRLTFNNFCKYLNKDIWFSMVKKITGGTGAYDSIFGSYYSANAGKWYFPTATEFTGYIWNIASNYSGEIHFAAKNQAAIEACDGYDKKWGFQAATIYFDLMLNITVNGVVYSRKHTIDGYTSWENASGNLVYTDATAEPAVDTVVYSDQGTTQVGTVSEAS